MDSILKFLAELIKRLFKKTPAFFKVVRAIGLILTVVAGLPALLESSGVVLPSAIAAIASKVLAIIGLVIAFIAQLTQVDPSDPVQPKK